MISCLVAVERNQGIGFNNGMPWPHLKDDMTWFKDNTKDQVIIMGANTWNSLSLFKPLPNRINVVVTKNVMSEQFNKADHIFSTPENAISGCKTLFPGKSIFIIGGQTLYDSTMHLIDRFLVTEIDMNYTCDKFFNLNYVKANCKTVIEHGTFTTPISYTIKEYLK
jgi:dihydrofolate reductase